MQALQTRHSMESPDELTRLSEATIERLNRLREDGQSYDELINEIINIYQSVELSLAHGGDTLVG